jgi:hypothetical protein
MNKKVLASKISKHPLIKTLSEVVDKKTMARLIVEEMMVESMEELKALRSKVQKNQNMTSDQIQQELEKIDYMSYDFGSPEFELTNAINDAIEQRKGGWKMSDPGLNIDWGDGESETSQQTEQPEDQKDSSSEKEQPKDGDGEETENVVSFDDQIQTGFDQIKNLTGDDFDQAYEDLFKKLLKMAGGDDEKFNSISIKLDTLRISKLLKDQEGYKKLNLSDDEHRLLLNFVVYIMKTTGKEPKIFEGKLKDLERMWTKKAGKAGIVDNFLDTLKDENKKKAFEKLLDKEDVLEFIQLSYGLEPAPSTDKETAGTEETETSTDNAEQPTSDPEGQEDPKPKEVEKYTKAIESTTELEDLRKIKGKYENDDRLSQEDLESIDAVYSVAFQKIKSAAADDQGELEDEEVIDQGALEDAEAETDQADTEEPAQPTSDEPEAEETETAGTEETGETDEDDQEADETGEEDKEEGGASDKTEKENPDEPSKEPYEIEKKIKDDFIEAAEQFQNEFYNQRYRKNQAIILKNLIDAISKITDDGNFAMSYGNVPAEEETEPGPLQEADENVEANEKQVQQLKMDFRSLLSDINKTTKSLKEFEDVASKGSVLTDAYKKNFMELLASLQKTLFLVVRDMRNIIKKQEGNIQEAKEESEKMKTFRAVKKAYVNARKGVIAVRGLLDGDTPTEKPEDVIGDTYQAVVNLSQYFPSINPFNKGAKTKQDYENYLDSFKAAVKSAKSSLGNVLNFVKQGETGEATIKSTIQELKNFSAQIAAIFGVESQFEDKKVEFNDEAAQDTGDGKGKDPEGGDPKKSGGDDDSNIDPRATVYFDDEEDETSSNTTTTPEPEEEDIDQIMANRIKRGKYIKKEVKKIFSEDQKELATATEKVLRRFAMSIIKQQTNEVLEDEIFAKIKPGDPDKDIKANYNYKNKFEQAAMGVENWNFASKELRKDRSKLIKFVKVLNQIIDYARDKAVGPETVGYDLGLEERLANKLKPLIKEMLRRN